MANGYEWKFAETMEISKSGLKLENPILSLAFYILALTLTYVLSSDWKHRLIYMRWNDPLPGSRVFTDLIDKDSRITPEDIINEHGALPVKANEQNALWYKIYKTKQSDKVVQNSHGRWLLFRDIFSIGSYMYIRYVL